MSHWPVLRDSSGDLGDWPFGDGDTAIKLACLLIVTLKHHCMRDAIYICCDVA